MKTKKILLILIGLTIATSYLFRDELFGNPMPKLPNPRLDFSDEINEEEARKKSYNSNIKPFNTVKTRIFGESKKAAQKLLGRPNKVLSPLMYSNWSVLIYYNKVRDEFDNDRVKHLAVWIEIDDNLNSKVTKVKCVSPNSTPSQFQFVKQILY